MMPMPRPAPVPAIGELVCLPTLGGPRWYRVEKSNGWRVILAPVSLSAAEMAAQHALACGLAADELCAAIADAATIAQHLTPSGQEPDPEGAACTLSTAPWPPCVRGS